MKFCEKCENMLYITVSNDDSMLLYCKNCNYSFIKESNETTHVVSHQFNDVTDKEDPDSNIISSVNYNVDVSSYKQYLNPLIKYDPTLPRMDNIDCPNCQPAHPEVIYIKYDHKNMKYLYFCCNCDHFWK